MAHILFVDNFDSFTYNLVDQFRELGHQVTIFRNDYPLDDFIQKALTTENALVALSPGPGNPAEAGNLLPIIQQLKGKVPMIGICLGHQAIIEALGGAENIEDVDACITRLRVAVRSVDKVDKATLKSIGAVDVLEVNGGVQAIYGAKAILYKNNINEILGVDD